MKNCIQRVFLISILLLSSIGCEQEESSASGGSVYICTGSGAYAYHSNRNCSGLNNCKADIVTTSLSKAKKSRKACNICYR